MPLKLARSYHGILVVSLLCLLTVGVQASTVMVDVQGKSVTSDDPSLETKWVKQKGEQVLVIIQNTKLDPCDTIVKVNGLNDP
ncbi:MAG: hypothetical protein N3B12_06675, partial [Armatimonadetes bacterium]|nr:hypothetical protein [Armatimonadota bacterium]